MKWWAKKRRFYDTELKYILEPNAFLTVKQSYPTIIFLIWTLCMNTFEFMKSITFLCYYFLFGNKIFGVFVNPFWLRVHGSQWVFVFFRSIFRLQTVYVLATYYVNNCFYYNLWACTNGNSIESGFWLFSRHV